MLDIFNSLVSVVGSGPAVMLVITGGGVVLALILGLIEKVANVVAPVRGERSAAEPMARRSSGRRVRQFESESRPMARRR